MSHLTSANQSTNLFATIHQRARDSRGLHVWIVVLLATLFLALASRANAQNVQYDDKALDLGSRGAARVDPATRGLSFAIPLGSYPGRAGLNVPVTLSYTSKVWNVEFQGYNGGTNPPAPPMQPFTIVVARYAKHSVAGWTSSIGMPIVETAPNHQHLFNQIGEPKIGNVCLQQCWAVNRIMIWMPDGSGHELRASDAPRLVGQDPVPDNFYSVDESRMRYQVSTGTLFMPDGSRYLLNSSQYIDRNGNKLASSGGSWTDSLGRPIPNPLPYNAGTSPAAGDQNVPLPGVGGTPINYVLKWRNLADVLTTPQSLRYVGNTGCPPEISGPYSPSLFGWDSVTRTCIGNSGVLFNPVVLSQIVLPTGQAYTFTYNVYGEIDKVVMPTGAYETYQYGLVSPLTFTTSVYPKGNRGVTSRTISPSGLAADEATWTYSGGFGTATIVGPAPESKRTEISFWTDSNGSWGYSPNGARAGRVYDERTYNSSGQMLSRNLTDWTMTGSQTTVLPGTELANRHARPIREVEFVLDTGGSALARTTTYTYDTTYQFTVGVERSSVKVYDFVNVDQTTAQTIAITSLSSIPNGTLLARTAITYLTSQQNYRDRNFLGLPTSVSLYNSNDVLMSQTTYSYDEVSYPLISVGSPPYTGWTDPGTTVRGNATTAASWLNTSGTFLQTHSQYDQFGNVRKSWDEKLNLTEIDYSSAFAFAYPTQVTSADPDGGGPGVALVTASEFDFSTGRTTATIDANNKRTTIAYNDPLNRIKQIVRASTDTVANVQTTYTYDDANRTITVFTDQSNFNDNLIKNQSAFDGLGRVVENRQYETATNYITVKTEYDILGRAYRSSNPYRAGEAIVWTTTEYDSLSRATSITTPDGAIIRTAYAGERVLNTDQTGKQHISKVNALGQLTDVWEVTPADGATEATSFPSHPEVSAGYRTSYQYDALSNLVKVNQGSQQRYFMYDSLKRLIRVSGPEQGTNVSLNLLDPITGNAAWSTGYQYDANSNLSQKTDARGVVSTYVYDALNRVTTIDYSDTVSINPDLKRFYDGATNGKGRFWYFYSNGDFSNGPNADSMAIDNYDALGRPLVTRQLFKLNNVWVANGSYQTTRAYNRAGGVISQTYPSGHTVAYTYDAAGRTSSFTGNLGDGTTRTYANNITYSPFGGLAKEQFGTTTPLYRKSFYNIRGQIFDTRLSSVNDTWDWNRGRLILYYSSNHLHGQSGTDNNGNVRFAEHWIPPANAALDQTDTLFEDAYTYDALNRLTSVAGQRMSVATGWGTWQQQFRQQYTYDRYGNRMIDAAQTWGTGINNKQFTVNTATNRYGVPSGQTGTMSYDLAGNLSTDTYTGSGAREYDAENKMTRAWGGDNQWQEYAYNADGQRVRRKINGRETWQVYGMDNELLAEYAANGSPNTPQEEYGYRNGQLLVTATPGGNHSLSGNGTSAYVQAPSSSSLNIVGPITVEAWIKINAIGAPRAIISREAFQQSGTGGGYRLSITDTGKVHLDLFQTHNTYVNLSGATTITTGVWHHVAGVFNGTQMRVYLNGVLDGSLSTTSGPASGTGNFHIGRFSYSFNPYYFNGLIDDARVSNTAVYTSNFTPSNNLTATGSTKGLWKFDGQTVNDSSGNNNHGTLQGGATYSIDAVGGGGSAGQVQWLVADHLGTPRMIVDQTGSLSSLKRHDYLPFGEELFAPAGGRSVAIGYSGGDGVRQQFTSKERDTEIGLDYFLARYYSSNQGRFPSPDPLSAPASGHPRIPQSWNLYAYVLNNPLKLVDPDGLMWIYHYLDKEQTKIGIAWIDGNKIPKNLQAQGYQALNFGGQSSRDVTLTDGSVMRLSANSGRPEVLHAAQGSGEGAYVNTGLVRELGRQTAPLPEATGLFIVASLAGGYNIAMVGGPLVLADAAAFGFVTIRNIGSDSDAQVMATTSSQFQDITNPGSIPNIKTDVSKADFIKNMETSGYKATRSGNATILDNGVNRYTVYDVARSTGGPTAVRSVGGEQTLKIRLKP